MHVKKILGSDDLALSMHIGQPKVHLLTVKATSVPEEQLQHAASASNFAISTKQRLYKEAGLTPR